MLPLRIASLIGVCVLTASCSGSTPVDPSRVAGPDGGDVATSSSRSPSTVQRVEEGGGGGGGQCLVVPGIICGTLSLTAGDVAFVNNTVSVALTSNPLDFSVFGRIEEFRGFYGESGNPSPGGHFPTAHVSMLVAGGTASLTVTLDDLNDQGSFTTSGSAPAIQSLPACVAGKEVLVTTRVTVQLRYLGKTEVVESHARNCGV